MPLAWEAHFFGRDLPGLEELSARHTLVAAWAQNWRSEPGSPVLLDLTGRRRNGVGTRRGWPSWMTRRELEVASATAASRFARYGVGPGDRVVLCAPTSLDAVIAIVGALRCGVVVVPCNPAMTPRELVHVVGDSRAAAVVIDDGELRTAALATGVTVLTPNLYLASRNAGTYKTPTAGPPRLDEVDPSSPALIMYTSGTTGSPKGALHDHASLLAGLEMLRLAWNWEPKDRLAHVLPIFHAHGLCLGIFGTLLTGASAVLLGGFDADATLDAIADHQCTLLFAVPTIYHRLVSHQRAGELARLRLAVSGSAPLAPALHQRLKQVAGVDVLERYGTTETLMVLSNPVEGERRPGTVGFPLPGVEVSIEAGELLVRGPNVFRGYWERPHADAEAFAEGWFRTGDLADEDEAGYVRIKGRLKELIISGGFNVYPAEVEQVLSTHPGVGEVAVAGTASEEWGETVSAWVVPVGPLWSQKTSDLEAELKQLAERELSFYKRPRRYRFVRSLPRNAMGKIQRNLLGGWDSPIPPTQGS